MSILQVFRNHKFACISLLSILSAVSFNITVGMRESVILSLSNGASFVPFVKTYLTLPCTFLVGAAYLLIQKRLGTVLTYSSINWIFLSYFIIFSLVIAPNYSSWTPDQSAIAHYKSMYPNFRYFISLIEHWPSALFHVCAEIWSIYIFIILFWQVANEALAPGESSEFFPIVTFLISLGTTLSAYPIQHLGSSSMPKVVFLSIIIPLGMLMNALVVYIHCQWGLESSEKISTKKEPLSFFEKTKKLFDRSLSQEVLSLSLCMFSFNFIVSLFEICFWTRVSTFHTSQNDIIKFFGTYTLLKGLVSMFSGILNIYLLRRLGWFFVLKITPVICIFTINIFLLFHFPQKLFILPKTVSFLPNTISINFLLTWFFAIGLVLSYASKFSFFDPAKEILISTLPSEERRFSKVLADGISGRAGKISGGIVQSTLLALTAADNILDITPLLLIFACASSILFSVSINKLRRPIAISTPEADFDHATP